MLNKRVENCRKEVKIDILAFQEFLHHHQHPIGDIALTVVLGPNQHIRQQRRQQLAPYGVIKIGVGVQEQLLSLPNRHHANQSPWLHLVLVIHLLERKALQKTRLRPCDILQVTTRCATTCFRNSSSNGLALWSSRSLHCSILRRLENPD